MFLFLFFSCSKSYTLVGVEEEGGKIGGEGIRNLQLSADKKKKLKLTVAVDPKAFFICRNIGGIDGLVYFVSCIFFGFHRACARFCTWMDKIDQLNFCHLPNVWDHGVLSLLGNPTVCSSSSSQNLTSCMEEPWSFIFTNHKVVFSLCYYPAGLLA